MDENRLHNATLLSWTLRVFMDFKRGFHLTGQEAAVARAMQQHTEWQADWEAIERGFQTEDSATLSRLIHIHHDAATMLHLEAPGPNELKTLYDALREKGFTEFESIHVLALGLTEESAHARETNQDFSPARHLERAARYAKESLARPNLTRLAKAKAY